MGMEIDATTGDTQLGTVTQGAGVNTLETGGMFPTLGGEVESVRNESDCSVLCIKALHIRAQHIRYFLSLPLPTKRC